ncbi:branched-chain amino acid ABC transporter permease [Geminicoccus flavidas]|uniref:branched-chain amino acid ABC transporter permease n=1 Tax=Geminicoccus flavidas TaxID=2506407 RepID=UPI00135CAE00|nr:branched-chain amino acid ABC transporter permease [Geminicoccus flavidas]
MRVRTEASGAATAVSSRAPATPATIRSYARIVLPVLLLLFLLAAPGLIGSYHLHVLTLILIYVPCALGQNLITGNSGQLSMGHAAFFGLGAYAVAILSVRYGWPAFPALLAAAGAAGLVGLLIGLPAIRISGDYLFIVTIGVNLVFLDIVTQWVPVTGGTAGIPGLPMPSFGFVRVRSNVDYFYLALAIAALCFLVTLAITRSRFGKMIEASRDDPVAAAACGISLTAVRVSVFVIGAAMAGLAGGVLGYFIGFVGPSDFNVQQSLLIFEMAILGGLGSIWGSVAGAAILVGLPEILRFLQPYRLGLLGLIMIVLMIYRPQGLLGSVRITNLIRK